METSHVQPVNKTSYVQLVTWHIASDSSNDIDVKEERDDVKNNSL